MPQTSRDVVEALQALLAKRADLLEALEGAIRAADLPAYFSDLDGFYDFVAASVEQIPENSDAMMQMDLAYYYVVSRSKDRVLATDPAFQQWNLAFHDAWGAFLNSDASRGHLESYIRDKNFDVADYQEGPSGWHSFNQFFARQTKPGKRPIAELSDPSVVVSPCDCMILNMATIDADSRVTMKGHEAAISTLLADSEYSDAFAGGLYLSGFLQLFDYHRFHTPAAGTVLEARKIPGYVGMSVVKEDGVLTPVPMPEFQFTQDRALMVLETTHMGLVALLPVGMAQISSVVLTAEPGVELYKGEEFGYFQFGGSNILMLTQAGRFTPDPALVPADPKATPSHLLQGQRIGRAV